MTEWRPWLVTLGGAALAIIGYTGVWLVVSCIVQEAAR